MSEQLKTNRRNFLKTSGVLAVGASMAGTLGISRSAHAAGSDLIKVALIGCGGRGRGAIMDRAQVQDNLKVVAISDAFEERTRNVAELIRDEEFVDLPNSRVFSGFDAYKKAIDCLSPGDQIVLTTPPGLRPYQYRYAVEKGLHVFMEKPLFTDAFGYRHTMETNKIADEKGLKVCVGLQRRYEPHYYNWAKEIADGKIGDVSFTRVYWNGGQIWCLERRKDETEMSYQMRNWYHFVWLCGDNICEQHVHNLDIGNWIHGKGDKMAHPVKANAQGGRQNSAGPQNIMRTAPPYADKEAWWAWYEKNKGAFSRYGQAWDHFFVEYTYADGSRMFSQCRHINNTWDNVSEWVHGTKGTGGPGWLNDTGGNNIWRNTEVVPKTNPYFWEHDCHVKAIREGLPMNDAWYSAQATMTAVFGRMAAFSGKELNWDEAVAKGKRYIPGEFPSWDDNPPVMPDADGFYEGSVAKQGIYNPYEA